MGTIKSVNPNLIQKAYGEAVGKPQPAGPESGFGARLRELVNDVDRLGDQAAEIQNAALRGEEVAVHDVMIASEQAGLALTMMVEVRNKLIEAYQELMRMQA